MALKIIMSDKLKIILGGAGGLGFFALSVLAQTNALPVTPLPGPTDPNIMTAMFYQVLNNPASLLVIGFLCIVAWLVDDLPFVNSRYVAHATVMAGGAIYWMFATPDSVPHTFPYPIVVLVVNGTICGFVAFVIHRQAVARFINFVRVRSGAESSVGNTTLLKPVSTDAGFRNNPPDANL